jgi:RNA polymerase sigma factor (sigma-70 family)
MAHVRRVLGVPAAADLNDRQLLEQFAGSRDEAAFTALVQRYGPQVLGVCRRMLGNDHDADDVFQATFLVLAAKAGSIGWRESISSWLYNVAYHLAAKTRRGAIRRRQHELRAAKMAAKKTASCPDGGELHAILDDELQQLPEKYRMPLLLCYLQSQTREEAARQLGWTEIEVKGRMQRGRDLLRNRLLRRGLAITAGLPATLSQQAPAAVPSILVTTTVKAAVSGAVAAPVAALVRGALQAMFWSKLQTRGLLALAVVLTLGLGMSGIFYFYTADVSAQGAAPANVTKSAAKSFSKRDDPRVDPDRYDQADLVARVKVRGNLAYSGTVGGIITTFTILDILKNKTAVALDKEVRVNANGSPRVKIDNVIRGLNFDEECTIYLKLRDGGGWLYIENSVEKGVSHVSASKPKE